MAIKLSKTLRVRLLNQTSAANGGALFVNMNVIGFTFGLQRANDKVREEKVEFDNISRYKNYGELLVAINNSLRAIKINGLVEASLGDGFTVLDTTSGTRVSGREIVLTTKTAAFSLTDSNNHDIVRWLFANNATVKRGHREILLGTGVSEPTVPSDPTSPEDRYSKANKHIVLPLIFVSRGSDTDEQVSETPRTAVIEAADSSQRTAINVSRLLNYNPDGTLDCSGTLPREYERYVNNVLLGLSQRVLGLPDTDVFVTNPMKWVDVVDFEPGRIRFKKEQIDAYLEDTEQSGDRFKICVVIETVYTVHTAYFELELITDPEYETTVDRDGNEVSYPYALARVVLGRMPITDRSILFSVKAFYPILTIYSSVDIQFKETSNGPDYTFSCMVHPNENKRSIL